MLLPYLPKTLRPPEQPECLDSSPSQPSAQNPFQFDPPTPQGEADIANNHKNAFSSMIKSRKPTCHFSQTTLSIPQGRLLRFAARNILLLLNRVSKRHLLSSPILSPSHSQLITTLPLFSPPPPQLRPALTFHLKNTPNQLGCPPLYPLRPLVDGLELSSTRFNS